MTAEIIKLRIPASDALKAALAAHKPAAELQAGQPLALSESPTPEQVADHIWQMANEMADAGETAAVLRRENKKLRSKRDKQNRRYQRLVEALGPVAAALRPFAGIDPDDTDAAAMAFVRADLDALRDAYSAITARLGQNKQRDSDDE